GPGRGQCHDTVATERSESMLRSVPGGCRFGGVIDRRPRCEGVVPSQGERCRCMSWSSRFRLAAAATCGVLVAGSLTTAGVSVAAVSPHGVSAHCHVTDGTFTVCPDGSAEWSDVASTAFGPSNAHVYADQADLLPGRGLPNGSPVDTFMLMYDEC